MSDDWLGGDGAGGGRDPAPGGRDGYRDESLAVVRPAPGTYREGDDSADEAELYVERVGPTGAATVYYLHGGPGYSAYSFRELVGDDLASFDVIYADQRGGGRTYGAATSDTATLAGDVLAVLEALDVQRVTLLAHGFGAAVAARAAAERPDLVAGVVLVNPWLSLPLLASTLLSEARRGGPAADVPGAGDGDQELEGDPALMADEAFALVNPKVLFDAMQFPSAAGRLRLEHVDAVALSGDPSDEVAGAVWTVDELPALAAAASAGVRVVLLSGTHDRTSYPGQAEQALLRAPSALFSLLEAGHYPWLDDEEAFTDVLIAALQHAAAPA